MSFKAWVVILGLLAILGWGMFAGTASLMERGRAPLNTQLTQLDE